MVALVGTWMDDRTNKSISVDISSDKTINRGLLALLLRRQCEFPFGVNIVKFSISVFPIFSGKRDDVSCTRHCSTLRRQLC